MTALRTLAGTLLLVGGLTLGAPSGGVAQENAPIDVVVINHAFLSMHVYVVQLGQRRTLGVVGALSQQKFALPRPVAESDRDFQILAHPISDQSSFETEDILASPGQKVVLTLENNLNLSRIYVGDQMPPEGEGGPEPSETS